MAAFDDLGRADALATLAEAQAIGVKPNLTHAGTTTGIWTIILGQEIVTRGKGDGREIQELKMTFRVPVQAGFPVATTDAQPIQNGDAWEYPAGSGRLFYTNQIDKAVEINATIYVYDISAQERRTITAGLGS